MHPRHWPCSAGVEPRSAARHPAKNPPPSSSHQEIASVARSPAASSLQAVAFQLAPARNQPPCCAIAEAGQSWYPIPRTDDPRACSSAIAQAPSRETTQYSILLLSSPLQFLFPANALILGCLTLGGHSSPGSEPGLRSAVPSSGKNMRNMSDKRDRGRLTLKTHFYR